MTHLVICGHGQGRTGYDVGAVNRSLNITEAGKVRELADLMKRHATKTHFIIETFMIMEILQGFLKAMRVLPSCISTRSMVKHTVRKF